MVSAFFFLSFFYRVYFYVVHAEYIRLYGPMKILFMFVYTLITFYKALEFYSHVDSHCSLFVRHLIHV